MADVHRESSYHETSFTEGDTSRRINMTESFANVLDFISESGKYLCIYV